MRSPFCHRVARPAPRVLYNFHGVERQRPGPGGDGVVGFEDAPARSGRRRHVGLEDAELPRMDGSSFGSDYFTGRVITFSLATQQATAIRRARGRFVKCAQIAGLAKL